MAWLNFIFLMPYKTAPIVYDIPPAKSQRKPSKGKLFINGFKAKTITQPINTYIIVEIKLYLPVKNIFKIIPVKANPHEVPKITHPMVPFRVTSVKGVYVPAIRT